MGFGELRIWDLGIWGIGDLGIWGFGELGIGVLGGNFATGKRVFCNWGTGSLRAHRYYGYFANTISYIINMRFSFCSIEPTYIVHDPVKNGIKMDF